MHPLAFRLDVTHPERHRIHVVLEAEVEAIPHSEGACEFFLPVWTPGSYLVREYARHLEGFAASDADRSTPLPWEKTAKNRFRVDLTDPASGERCQRLRLSYAIYGHELTVRTTDVTDQHAFWNGACVFLWPVGGNELGATIDVEMPDDWQLATQLPTVDAGPQLRLVATNLDEVVDAPCLAGELDVRSFEHAGVSHSFVLDGLESVPVPDSLVPDTQRIIDHAAAIFGGDLPYEQYQFLSLFANSGRGGLEHTSSSVLLAPRTTFHPRKDYEDFMGLVAHEFFHVWNGKRMRPEELWHYDYEVENYTRLLWVTEGFTAYYDDLLCLRAGVLTSQSYLKLVADNIALAHKTPGRRLHPLDTASFDAWIKLYRPDENSRNSTQSYYTNGALAALCFDLHIRATTEGAHSLDDAVARLYRTTYGEGRGYRRDDVVACLSDAAGGDMSELVAELTAGPFEPDFERFLTPLGLTLRPVDRLKPYFGIQFKPRQMVVASVLTDGPGSEGGLAPGDEILAIDGLRAERSQWTTLLENLWAPGRSLRFLLARRGRIIERDVAPTPFPAESFVIEPVGEATEAQVALRTGWLGEAEG